MNAIPESDWKKLRSLKDIALTRACENIFDKVERVAASRKGQEHKSYLTLYSLIKKEDRKIAEMFDGLRRSNAIQMLTAWKYNKIITDEEFTLFSDETKRIVNLFLTH